MICRFIVALRAAANSRSEAISNPSYLRFQVPAILTANIGEPLESRFAAADEDGLEEEVLTVEYMVGYPAAGEDSQGDIVGV